MANQEETHHLDRLSALPDDILHRIFSSLDTKSAIKTSALSKHYRCAWTSLPSLDFKLKGFQRDYFEDYVTAVLQQRQPCDLQAFILSLRYQVSSEFIDRCIEYAATHNVQHLRIRGYTYPTVNLPQRLLTSTSLVTLRLNNATALSLQLPTSVSLPNLRLLRLKKFAFLDDNMQLFSGCPNLENLVLIKCGIRPNAVPQIKILDVNCPNLTSLEIRKWTSPWECFNMHMVDVFAPRLLLFKLQGQLVRVYFKSGPPCRLKEAYIDLSYPTPCSTARKQITYGSLVVLLFQIRKAGFLSLLSKTDKALSVRSEAIKAVLRLFVNLEIVEVRQEKDIKTLKRLFWPSPI